MSVNKENLRFYLTVDGLGGPPTNTTVKWLPPVRGIQAEDGAVLYSCIYLRNDDDDPDGFMDPFLWVAELPPQTDIALGLDPSGKNGTADRLARSTDEPSGVSWKNAHDFLTSVKLPDGPYMKGDHIAIWVRRTVPPGASPMEEMTLLRVRGETY